MRRREFISLLTGAAVGWPIAPNAQQAVKVARIGCLGQNLAPTPWAREAFREGLRDLGYVGGSSTGSPLLRPSWLRSKLMSLMQIKPLASSSA